MLLTIYNSKTDRNGNRYWAFQLTNHGKLISNGNVSANNFNTRDLRELGIEYTYQELPIREFNRMTKDWAYCGCQWEKIKEHMSLPAILTKEQYNKS
jgi:hypothetical protein